MALSANEQLLKTICSILIYQLERILPDILRWRTLGFLNRLLKKHNLITYSKKDEKITILINHLRFALNRGDVKRHDEIITSLREIYEIGEQASPFSFADLKRGKYIYCNDYVESVPQQINSVNNLMQVLRPIFLQRTESSIFTDLISSISASSLAPKAPESNAVKPSPSTSGIVSTPTASKLISPTESKFKISPLFESDNILGIRMICPKSGLYKKVKMTFASPFSSRYYVDSDGSGVRKLHPSYRVFFFCAENKPELNLAYPPGFSISVNDQFVNLSMVKIKPIVIAPFDITHLINYEGATNTVCLDYVSASKEFVFEVQLLKIVSLDRHITILKSDFLLSEAQCLQKLRKKDEDLGVTTDMVSLSLVCPISGARICHPGKSKSCEHIQCFDIGNFLTMNLTHPRWLCPICGCQCTYYDIVYDEFAGKVLNDPASSDQSSVFARYDGSWFPEEKKKESTDKPCAEDSEANQPDENSVIDLTGADYEYAFDWSLIKVKKEEPGVTDFIAAVVDDDDNDDVEDEVEDEDYVDEPQSKKRKKVDRPVTHVSAARDPFISRIEAPGESSSSAIVLE